MELLTIIFVLFVGLISGFIGSMVGGGGLISIPLLMFFGLPPQVAIATNKFGSLGFSVGSIIRFWKGKKIIWKYVFPLSLLGVFGGFFGANLLLNIDEELITKIVAVILLMLLPLILIKKDLGVKGKKITKTKKYIGYFVYFFVMIFGGFFGGGAGFLIIYSLVFFLGLTIIEVNATDAIPWLIQTIIALFIFISAGLVNFYYGISLLIGMLIGSYIGAHTAIKKGDKWIKSIFVIIILFAALKFLFF